MRGALRRAVGLLGLIATVLVVLIGTTVQFWAAKPTALAGPIYTYDVAHQLSVGMQASTLVTPLAKPTGQRHSAAAPAPPESESVARFAAEAEAPGTALARSDYPPNRGFLGEPVDTTLEPGTRVDRYGGPGGTFASPEGTPFEARSLRSTAINSPYNVYEVVNPVTVQGGITAPAFGYGCGGIQYEFGSSFQDLIEQGIIKRVGP